MLPGMASAVMGKVLFADPVLEYGGSYSNANTLTTYTFAGCAIGTPDASRLVVVGIGASNGGTVFHPVSSVTIGGVNATFLCEADASGSSGSGVTSHAELWAAMVPTGTTATIVVTMSGAEDRCFIGTWALRFLQSNTPVGTASQYGTDGNTSVNVNVPAKGVVIGVCYNTVCTGNITWTGITENYDNLLATNRKSGGGSIQLASANSSLTVSQSSNSTLSQTMAVAVFR